MRLRGECLRCTKCSVGGRFIDNKPCNVFSNLCIKTKFMVVGQNPGYHEVEQGTPFVGVSGKFFDEQIEQVLGITRKDIYICNTIRCYTEKNRPPTKEEVKNCEYFLDREIEILKPKVVVTLGSFAFKRLTEMDRISLYHGQIITSARYNIKVFPLYHPSPLNMNRPDRKQEFVRDLEKLGEFLKNG